MSSKVIEYVNATWPHRMADGRWQMALSALTLCAYVPTHHLAQFNPNNTRDGDFLSP